MDILLFFINKVITNKTVKILQKLQYIEKLAGKIRVSANVFEAGDREYSRSQESPSRTEVNEQEIIS
ncbi:hypothetical protein [Nostoc sp.]|uniref:hypothetical protein n=1 Tax=Nostoc sp. TaxID=1180 RepID=UPI002FF46471